MTTELASLGNKLSRITVAKYMNQLGSRSKLSKKFKDTTNSKHKYLVVPNVLNREFSVTEPSKAWVTDITYIRVKEGFLYLTTVLDLYDRKIIGWSLSKGMSAEEPFLATWRMVIKNRSIEKGLVFHCFACSSKVLESDRGVQYAGKKIVNVLDSYKKITRSMSRKGNCWENAVTESFFKSLKTELIYGNKLISKEQMKLEICDPSEANRRSNILKFGRTEKGDILLLILILSH